MQPQVQRAEGRRLGKHRAQLNANAPLRDRKADEAEVQYREFVQLPIVNRRAQPRPEAQGSVIPKPFLDRRSVTLA